MGTKTVKAKAPKSLRYVLRTVIVVRPEDAADVSELIAANREHGSCEIEDISLTDEQP